MLDYRKCREEPTVPGFEVEVQGIYRELEKDGTVRFYLRGSGIAAVDRRLRGGGARARSENARIRRHRSSAQL